MPATLAYYLHNLDPYVFRIGNFGPRWYGLAYLMGFLCAYLLIRKLNRDGMLRLRPKLVADLVLNACIFGVLVGGRLGFVLFYDLPNALKEHRTPLLWDFSTTLPFWGALKVWDGGMAAHGGIVFSILTLMVFAWKYLGQPTTRQLVTLIAGVFVMGATGWMLAYVTLQDENFRVAGAMIFGIGWLVYCGKRYSIPAINIGDAACMVVPIGLFFGRIANFINGELYGHPTNVPWAVKFPSEIYAPTNGVHDPGVMAQLIPKLQVPLDLINGDVLQERALDEFGRKLMAHDPAAMKLVEPILLPRHPSQLYEALMEGALLFAICWTVGRIWRKDGMASGAFLVFYPIMRILGEQFRVGDTPVMIGNLSVSKGVLYSLPMLFAGAIYWGYFIRKSKPLVWTPIPDEPEEPADKEPRRLKTS
ncbi:MAG TPA: prolipoprotein diacylglyceryl transferase [Phycisphaerae bacterium]|jgi:phosphatidylglycerol:prolipoprotein diacylglycerol transferase|nr:prolipoprotein diacylglyceryl transferase [Phycisphaerae bacterium]